MAARKDLPRPVQALLAGAAVALLVGLLQETKPVRFLEFKTRDTRMSWTLPAAAPEGQFDHPEIGLVMITDQSIKWMEEESKRGWPWPREVFGFLFRACALGKAKVILFDLFTHVDKDFFATEGQWAEDIKKSPPSYLAVPFSPESIERADKRQNLEALLKRYEVAVDSDGSVEFPDPYKSVLLPQPVVAEAIAGVSDVLTPRDEDGITRHYRILTKFRGRFYPSFALAALLAREGVRHLTIRDRILSVGRLSFPVDRDGMITLRFYPRFRALPASSVLTGLWSIEDEKKVTTFDPKNVENRIILIGTDAAALFDLKVTPVTNVMPGTEMHATAIRNLLDRQFMRTAPVAVSILLMVLLSLATALITRFTSAAAGGGATAALLLGYGGLSVALFQAHWIVDLAAPLMAIVLAYAATSAVNFMHEGRQRLQVKRTFAQLVSPKVVDKILKHPDALHLEGERKPLTIFFMDFAGFTAMSEKLDPSELVKLISEYHNEAAEEIFRTEGTLDKFIGDAIMAFWNDPIEQPDHALRACLTAVAAQKKLLEMAKIMKERGLPEMSARIGLNTGVATVGNMGAQKQVNYTLIGDEVNLASRLEGVNKEFGTKIIISEATYLPAKEHLEVRELALIKVKGKKLPVRIFELIGRRGEAPPERLETVRKFEAALAEFRGRKFSKAWEMFLSLAQRGDHASEVYVGLCERYMNEPPHGDWDGSYQMETK
jgi:adenylate cyclase